MSWRSKGEINDMRLQLNLLEACCLEEMTQERGNAEVSPTRSGSETGFLCGAKGDGIPFLERFAIGRTRLIKFGELEQATWT